MTTCVRGKGYFKRSSFICLCGREVAPIKMTSRLWGTCETAEVGSSTKDFVFLFLSYGS